jgi:hypothetical protein
LFDLGLKSTIFIHRFFPFQNAEYTNGQLCDLAEKLEQAESQLGRHVFPIEASDGRAKQENKLEKVSKDACKTAIECLQGLMSQVIKDRLFNQFPPSSTSSSSDKSAEGVQDEVVDYPAIGAEYIGLGSALGSVFALLGGDEQAAKDLQKLGAAPAACVDGARLIDGVDVGASLMDSTSAVTNGNE